MDALLKLSPAQSLLLRTAARRADGRVRGDIWNAAQEAGPERGAGAQRQRRTGVQGGVISRQGCPVSSDPADTPACLTHRTQFHVTLYTRARARASRKVTTTCVRCVRRGAKARGPISATQPANRLQTRTSIEFSSLAVFARTGVQTCKPGTHQGSHSPLSQQSRTRQR